MKKCIFYLPYKLDENGMGARMLRPRKMLQAFRDIGYEVEVVEGLSADRREKIRALKAKILSGETYDFMYTESHTEPTLLTDPRHLPTHPFLDFGFFRFVHQHGIPIGLFYCDIYWKFDLYGKDLPAWKKNSAIFCYRYDVRQYKKYLSRFYLPDLKMCTYLKEDALTAIAEELPPGAENIGAAEKPENGEPRDFTAQPLTVFYVGGLGSAYQMTELTKAVQQTENTRLILCCRPAEWEKEKANYEPYLCDRITVIHKSSHELEPYYREADICSLLFKRDEYRELAKPFKAFEYLAHEIPVLSTKGTAIGAFVEKNDIGWNVDFDAEVIAGTFRKIIADPGLLEEKRKNCHAAKQDNLWTSRAGQVAAGLVKKG